MDKLQLDIACGKNKKHGFTGVDIWTGADIVCDLEKFPWPFEDGSVDEIFCSHYIEHTQDIISFANELYRIMKTGAKAEIIAPYYSSIRAWQDPTHVRAISENTFLYFKKDWREINGLDHYPLDLDFDVNYRFVLNSDWLGKNGDELKFAIRHYINVVDDIHVILTKKNIYESQAQKMIDSANNYWNQGKYDEAIVICNGIVASGTESTDILLMLGEFALKHNEFTKAISSFRQALFIDNDSVQAHLGLVRSLYLSGMNKEVEKHIKTIKGYDAELAEFIEENICMS